MSTAANSNAAAPGGQTVGAVASLTGVTIRTLHHWDSVGLVNPSGRSRGGYRLYSAADVDRVRRILLYRELGMPLPRIGTILDAAEYAPGASLQQLRADLLDSISRLETTVEAVDRMIEAADGGIRLSPGEQVAVFGSAWQPSWVARARDRWGTTDQWAQYAERSAVMTTADWTRNADSASALTQALAEAMSAGVVAGSPEANTLAERHREWISGYFACSHSMQVCVARTYTADEGSAAYYDATAPGLNRWLRNVIDASAAAAGVDPETAVWE
ncbi:MerR family transcriptional regulator [Arthrobacter sp. ATA002]|uniref:MerR family transcriptional regulator n=1 Tax=Arthrobacter sp. ATA002 TaxID=2991715 RepID=UPI0022A7E5E7|nr:MerR family transcriptional regulator [Arthrobacter sp. ATA002]WAP51701.1 MerR family transcriptional regulator [Arthrobacter sp. ATA002]